MGVFQVLFLQKRAAICSKNVKESVLVHHNSLGALIGELEHND